MQFNILTSHGLREYHKLLDIGCGSLRGGRLFIVYLLEGNYFGVEPEEWLIEDGINHELGQEIIKMKRPRFTHNSDFDFSVFNQNFDFIVAQSIFTHTSIDQMKICLDNVKKVLNNDGKFFLTYKKGPEDYLGKKWYYPYCVKYTPSTMDQIITSHGFRYKELDWKHPNDHTWLLLEKV